MLREPEKDDAFGDKIILLVRWLVILFGLIALLAWVEGDREAMEKIFRFPDFFYIFGFFLLIGITCLPTRR